MIILDFHSCKYRSCKYRSNKGINYNLVTFILIGLLGFALIAFISLNTFQENLKGQAIGVVFNSIEDLNAQNIFVIGRELAALVEAETGIVCIDDDLLVEMEEDGIGVFLDQLNTLKADFIVLEEPDEINNNIIQQNEIIGKLQVIGQNLIGELETLQAAEPELTDQSEIDASLELQDAIQTEIGLIESALIPVITENEITRAVTEITGLAAINCNIVISIDEINQPNSLILGSSENIDVNVPELLDDEAYIEVIGENVILTADDVTTKLSLIKILIEEPERFQGDKLIISLDGSEILDIFERLEPGIDPDFEDLDPIGNCGNNFLNDGEECDSGKNGELKGIGNLYCFQKFDLDEGDHRRDLVACDPVKCICNTKLPECGNGIIDPHEDCENDGTQCSNILQEELLAQGISQEDINVILQFGNAYCNSNCKCTLA